eukprot:403368814
MLKDLIELRKNGSLNQNGDLQKVNKVYDKLYSQIHGPLKIPLAKAKSAKAMNHQGEENKMQSDVLSSYADSNLHHDHRRDGSPEKRKRMEYYHRANSVGKALHLEKTTSKTVEIYENRHQKTNKKFFIYSKYYNYLKILGPPSSDEEEYQETHAIGIMPLMQKLATVQYNKVAIIKEKNRKQGVKNSSDIILKELAHRKGHKYTISYNSHFKVIWDSIIILMCVLISLMNSICVAFDTPFRHDPGYIVLNQLLNIILIVDMILIFRTSRLDLETGEEINNPRDIAKHYIKSIWLIIDILSIIPFDMFAKKDLLVLFNLLKVFKVGRSNKIISNINVSSQAKIIFKLVYMIALLLLYIHFLACLIYYIMKLNKTWLPPSESLGVGLGFYEVDDYANKYATMLYYSVLMYLINETAPTGLNERQFVQVVAILSAIYNANIFGNITVLIQELKKKQVQFQADQDATATAMTNLQLPYELQSEIREKFQLTQLTKDEPEELKNFLNNISVSLRQKVQVYVMGRVLKDNNVILGIAKHKYDATIEFMVQKMKLIMASPEDIIIKEGDNIEKNPNMFFIAQGSCIVEQQDRISVKKQGIKIRNLEAGDYFGEVALIYNCRRSTSVLSQNYSTLAKLSQVKFKEIIQKFPKLEILMKSHMKLYNDPQLVFIMQSLTKVPYFDFLSDDDRNSLVFNFEQQNFKKWSLIQDTGVVPKNLMILQRGSVINHNLFLLNSKTKIPIKCVTTVQMLNLPYEKVMQIKNKNQTSSLNQEMDQLIEYYEKQGVEKVFLDYVLPTPLDLKTNEEKNERRNMLNKQLKNAAIMVLNKLRLQNQKANFNDIIKSVIIKNKEQKRHEKQRAIMTIANMLNQEQQTEIVAINADQARDMFNFLNQMEKAVLFQSEVIEHIDSRFKFSITEGAANSKLLKLREIQSRKKKRRSNAIQDGDQVIINLKRGNSPNLLNPFDREILGKQYNQNYQTQNNAGDNEVIRLGSFLHPQLQGHEQTLNNQSIDITYLGKNEEEKTNRYQRPNGIRDSVKDDEIEWILNQNNNQRQIIDYGNSNQKLLYNDDDEANYKSPDKYNSHQSSLVNSKDQLTPKRSKDRSYKMKQIGHTNTLSQKKLETQQNDNSLMDDTVNFHEAYEEENFLKPSPSLKSKLQKLNNSIHEVKSSAFEVDSAIRDLGIEIDDKDGINVFENTSKSTQQLLNNDRAYTKLQTKKVDIKENKPRKPNNQQSNSQNQDNDRF